MARDPTTEFSSRLQALRPYLLRYASLQLRDPEAAGDAVQETLLAALEGQKSFAGRSNLRTWLTGILKHKIVDAIRRASREPSATSLAPAAEDSDDFDALFDTRGHWAEFPPEWGDPDAALQQSQFFAVLEDCLKKLPEKTARAFMMREHLGMETGEICKELGLTATHCWVLLYRARMALRLCVETNWFGAAGKAAS
jgi:RNA polymerase sigma-70 factor (ECF subfamily)